jgi:predicted secreted protein
MDLSGVTWRWYPGDEAQTADPFIAARMGAASTPAYRGTAYVVFEELALSTYGNRLPQLSFEVFRPLADADTAEGLTRAVTMIPASGEFTYATQAIRKTDGGATVPENLNALADSTDMVEALVRLQAMAPAVESVSLVVAWFGDDLRAGSCKVRPGVEVASKTTTPSLWAVNGVARSDAFLVSRDAEDRPVYGGTLADFAGMKSFDISASGVLVDDVFRDIISDEDSTLLLTDVTIEYEDGGEIAGDVYIASCEFAGAHDGESTYTLSLQSSGKWTWTAPAP